MSGGNDFPPLAIKGIMTRNGDINKLSVFVDESGSFLFPDSDSRFYIIGMVFHDQSVDIGPQLKEMDRAIEDIEMSRREFAEGKGIPSDEVFREMDELIKVWANEKRSMS